MAKYSKYNIAYRLQKWMDSVPGQTFLNYAYSWGASIVILGTLFKLTHLPGANVMLYLGMGTEVLVFFISAFDRPFDKTAIGKELPTHIEDDEDDEYGETDNEVMPEDEVPAIQGQVPAGGTIIIGGGYGGGAVAGEPSEGMAAAVAQGGAFVAQPPVTADMAEATNSYVEELQHLTEMLGKVAEQSQKLTTDSEEMENLNRTLTGICKVYEMQLKSASSQIGTIDEINAQTRRMAQQIEQLNQIYARMIDAMTTNMMGTAKV